MRTSFVPGVYRLPNVLLRLRHPVRTECVRRLATRPVQKAQNVETLFILRCYLSREHRPWFPPPEPRRRLRLPMAEPAAPAAPVKEDKDYVAEVIRQLSIP